MLLVVVDQFHFWQSSRLDTDVLALLPPDEQQPVIDAITRKLTDENGRQLVLLVGAKDWAQTRKAASVLRESLASQAALLQPAELNAGSVDAALAFYKPWRDRLLSPGQRQRLQDATPEQLKSMALMRLYQPASASLTDWRQDPLGSWQDWWIARGGESDVRLRDGDLWLNGQGQEWILMPYESRSAAFAVSGAAPLTEALNLARLAVAHALPDSRVLAAGVPLYAEAAAAQANDEMSTIGLGSLLAVLLLVWLAFRSIRPILLVGLSLLVGCAVALSVTALLFDKVHLLTLVFGSSLVGVAEDYGFHYFSARQGKAEHQKYNVLRALLPGLFLALATSVLAYLTLGIAPFPGLQQMAVFSATGLCAAFLTVLCWFPSLDRGPLVQTPFASKVADILQRWPRLQFRGRQALVIAVISLLTVVGLLRLDSQDDIRQLYSAPKALLTEQIAINQLLGLPSPAQFFLVQGDSAEQVLIHEAALTAKLEPLVAQGTLRGYRAVSDWIPALAVQAENRALTQKADAAAWKAIEDATGQAHVPAPSASDALSPEVWFASPVSAAIRAQWLGAFQGQHYSVMLLRGLPAKELRTVADVALGLQGVQWVNRTEQISGLMARYRFVMAGYLAVGYVAVLLVLLWRFRRQAWRAWMPTLLGSLMTLAIFGWTGQPIQLFTVLALLLLLGMGVDYGIFLLEHPEDGSAWVAVALAGVSTLLSFGLLALSATPALRAFGLTMLLGEVLVWVLTPFFRPFPPPVPTVSPSHA
ncbi:MMPL family transporter [Rhodoferax sp.]|uniref:MMPL family transporter n=1 Tax=Rhodoferax sp. TaxID=50421 RepID=UPI002ACE8778|nr:MMPL family transporter [Rhodoferax sp.]